MSRHTAPDELLLDYAAGALAHGPGAGGGAACRARSGGPPHGRAAGRRGRRLLEGEAAGGAGRGGAGARAGAAGPASPSSRRRRACRRGPASNGRRRRLRRHLGPGDALAARLRRLRGDPPRPAGRRPSRVAAAARARPRPAGASPRPAPSTRSCCRAATPTRPAATASAISPWGPAAEQHEPIADPGEPCIALIVLEKPIVLTGPWGRWLNPLVRRDLI